MRYPVVSSWGTNGTAGTSSGSADLTQTGILLVGFIVGDAELERRAPLRTTVRGFFGKNFMLQTCVQNATKSCAFIYECKSTILRMLATNFVWMM
jgi:hypothetical protein